MLAGPGGALAATIGINFTGTVDLTAYGASSASTFDTSLTWDTTTVATTCGGNCDNYLLSSAALSINATDYSGDINLSTSFMNRVDNAPIDSVNFVLQFLTGLDLGVGVDVGIINLKIFLPASFFAGTPIPQDLSFLQASSSMSASFRDTTFNNSAIGSQLAAVPEPGTAILLLLGLALLGTRRSHGGSEQS